MAGVETEAVVGWLACFLQMVNSEVVCLVCAR